MEGGFRVGSWQVQPDIGTVTRGEEQFQLEPKVMEVLVYLARHPGDLLPKEKIIRAVWPDTFVTDEVLTNAISELRKAFGDNAKNPAIIQTFPRRGYRLIATVSPSDQGAPEEATPASSQLSKQSLRVVLVAGLVLAVAIVMWWRPDSRPEEPIDSIAILPFENVSGNPDNEYLSEGIAAKISSDLSRLSDLKVIPTAELTRFRDQASTPLEAGEQLGVRAVLNGSLLRQGESLSVLVELTDVDAGRLRWGEQYTQMVSDIFNLQEQVAQEIVHELRLRLTEKERKRLFSRPTNSVEAYDLYLRGRSKKAYDMYSKGKEKDFDEAIAYFELALEEDPSFALAHVGLAHWYITYGSLETLPEYYAKAKDAADRALLLDPELAEAHWIKGIVLAYYHREWKAAEEELALYRQLGHADPSFESNWLYTSYFLWMGRPEESLAATESRTAYDPLTTPNPHMYFFTRNYRRAVEVELTRGLSTPYLLTLCYGQLGMEEEALRQFLRFDGDTLGKQESYQHAFARSGMKGVWRLFLEYTVGKEDEKREHYGYGKLYDVAATYAYLEDKNAAFEWLDRAREFPIAHPFVADVRFDPLRDDLRFELLLRKLNLPEEAIAIHLKGVP